MLRLSEHFPQTRRATGREDRVTPGHALLERGGFLRSGGAAGIFTLLPAGWRVHRRICDAIFDEMERGGVQNLQLPILQQQELWERSGRWNGYVKNKVMFQTTEEHRGTKFGLAPTAEEVVTALVAGDVKSWRELPLRLHQIGPKFRDEIRPRLGLLRCREFVMSDAYSFDRDEAGMKESFELFCQIYTRIFDRLGLEDVISVQADSGPIGGSGSAEFMVVNDVGEDSLLSCGACGYGANAEKADSRYRRHDTQVDMLPLRIEPTPGITTVEELQRKFPKIRAEHMIKTLIFTVDPEGEDKHLVAVCIRGDLEVNEIKLSNLLRGVVVPASAEEIETATGAPVGFAGPIGLRGVREIHFDISARGMRNFLCGVNEKDVHALDVNFERDVSLPDGFVDLHLAKGGHGCPEEGCGGTLEQRRGIEIGHVFMLQQGYAEALDALYTTEDGQEKTMWMGCYGIGTTRLLQAIAEQAQDGEGLTWPAAVSPYDLHVVLTQPDVSRQTELLAELETVAGDLRLELIADERSVSPGVKFKDADLLGCPVRVTIGRKAEEGVVEVKRRKESSSLEMTPGDLAGFMHNAG
jgi:prolyl-tRNA synthetase